MTRYEVRSGDREERDPVAEADALFEKEMALALYPEAAIGHSVEHLIKRGGDRARIAELAQQNYDPATECRGESAPAQGLRGK